MPSFGRVKQETTQCLRAGLGLGGEAAGQTQTITHPQDTSLATDGIRVSNP